MVYDHKTLIRAKDLIDKSLVLAPSGTEMLEDFYTVCAAYVINVVQKSVTENVSPADIPVEHKRVDLEHLMDAFSHVKRNIGSVLKRQQDSLDLDSVLPYEPCFVQDLAGVILEKSVEYKKS